MEKKSEIEIKKETSSWTETHHVGPFLTRPSTIPPPLGRFPSPRRMGRCSAYFHLSRGPFVAFCRQAEIHNAHPHSRPLITGSHASALSPRPPIPFVLTGARPRQSGRSVILPISPPRWAHVGHRSSGEFSPSAATTSLAFVSMAIYVGTFFLKHCIIHPGASSPTRDSPQSV
jgi:hypothetical protein